MTSRLSAIIFRLVFAAASITAMSVQLFGVHIPKGYSTFNFFTYFTNLSNILISVVFIVSAVRLITRRSAPTPTDTAFRGAAVVYIAFVGIVFNTLLQDVDLGDLLPWVNIVLHYVLPVVGVLDWILWPPKNRLGVRVIAWWMIFPAVYAVFSVVRGAFTDIYPYPFFNPAVSGGYGGVVGYCIVMLIGFLVLAFATWFLGNWRGGHLRKGAASTAGTTADTDAAVGR